jgi:hypothetical protein
MLEMGVHMQCTYCAVQQNFLTRPKQTLGSFLLTFVLLVLVRKGLGEDWNCRSADI